MRAGAGTVNVDVVDVVDVANIVNIVDIVNVVVTIDGGLGEKKVKKVNC